MKNDRYAEYNAAIGSLMAARKLYADACENQGPESGAAEQAQDYLTREIKHRDQARAQYDAEARHRPPGEADG
jgi:hypothetical protein